MADRKVWVIERDGVPKCVELTRRTALDLLALAGMQKRNELVRYVPESDLARVTAELEQARAERDAIRAELEDRRTVERWALEHVGEVRLLSLATRDNRNRCEVEVDDDCGVSATDERCVGDSPAEAYAEAAAWIREQEVSHG